MKRHLFSLFLLAFTVAVLAGSSAHSLPAEGAFDRWPVKAGRVGGPSRRP